LQVSFFSVDKRFPKISEDSLNIPSKSGIEELNLTVNTIAKGVDEEWKPLDFDFLVNGVLVRTELAEFVESNNISAESVIKIECILKEPAPTPRNTIFDDNWVSDVKAVHDLLFSINYAGELSLWSRKAEKLWTVKVDNDMAKCMDVFELGGERHIVVGVQNQFLALYKQETIDELIPCAVLRGHQRSVECVAANSDGTRLISGGFDNCLKVWNTGKDDGNDDYEKAKPRKAKIVKPSAVTKVPMVTLESHREAVVGAQWSPHNEGQAVTASWDCSVMCWDLERAEASSVLTSNKAFTSLSLNSATGLMITGSTDPVIRLWDFRSKEGSMVKESFFGHLSWVSSVCWAPDSDHLFASGSYDKLVKMWDIRSPKAPLYDISGHEDKVLKVDWSVKEQLVSGSADSTIRIFDL